jgi:hypothetical protein
MMIVKHPSIDVLEAKKEKQKHHVDRRDHERIQKGNEEQTLDNERTHILD